MEAKDVAEKSLQTEHQDPAALCSGEEDRDPAPPPALFSATSDSQGRPVPRPAPALVASRSPGTQ